MTYLTMAKPRASTGTLAYGEPKNQNPFTTPVLPKAAPSVFQVNPYTNTGSASASAQGYTTAGPATAGQAGSLAAPTATVSANGGATGPAAPSSNLYDPTTDPIYQKIKQLGASQVSQAVAGGDALRKQILIQLGDPTFAHAQQFGDPNAPTYGDTSTEQAAQQNPYSTIAGLAKTHTSNVAGIDQAANKAGGFYSSTHANQLGDENFNYNQGISSADSAAGGQLSSIVQQILQAQNTAQSANIGAIGTATQNAINSALANGYSFGGYDSSGQPILTKPPGGAGDTTGAGAGLGLASGSDQTGDPYGLGPVDPSAPTDNSRSYTPTTAASGLAVTSPLHAVIAQQAAQKVRTKGAIGF